MTMYMDLLSPEQQKLCLIRFNQRPSEWPDGMREGVDVIAHKRHPGCSEDVIEVIAEWMLQELSSE